MQSLPFEGTSMGISCAYTTVMHTIVLIAEELGYVFTRGRDITVLIAEELAFVFIRGGNICAQCANQAGKARLALVKAAARAVIFVFTRTTGINADYAKTLAIKGSDDD